jgi:hypothetical protein
MRENCASFNMAREHLPHSILTNVSHWKMLLRVLSHKQLTQPNMFMTATHKPT